MCRINLNSIFIGGVKIIIRPIDNSIKNKYDSILKIASHAFVNALIPIMDLPEDDYVIVSCEIFSPGDDVKSMDILLEGKNGLINIEFHKQPLKKKDLDRDFGYVSKYYLKEGQIIDQRIVVVDMDKKSVEKIQITPKNSFVADCCYIPNIDGGEVLSSIKNKVKNNQKLTEYEKYIFSILPLTNHNYDDEEKLVKELCYITPKLNISEQDRDSISLCQMILVDLFVNDEFLIEELLEVITMTSSHILERENKLKKAVFDAENDANNAKKALLDAEKDADNAKKDANKARKDASNFRKALLEICENAEKLKLSDEQKKILFSTSVKL